MWRVVLFSLAIVYSSPAAAAIGWFFKGQCYDSYLKSGSTNADLRDFPPDVIRCEVAVLTELKNGRKLMNFVSGRGVLGFSGSVIGPLPNRNTLGIPIDRIYPIRDLGMDASEILKRASEGEGALKNADGFCFFEPGVNLAKTKNLSCISKFEDEKRKIVYRVLMKVDHVNRRAC